jgi:hypothetical protein
VRNERAARSPESRKGDHARIFSADEQYVVLDLGRLAGAAPRFRAKAGAKAVLRDSRRAAGRRRMIRRGPVNSSNVKSIGYDHVARALHIEFHSGGVYEYAGVAPEVHDALMDALSKRKFPNAHIKGKFITRKL